MNAGPLGRFALRIEHATAVVGPGLSHEFAHTGADSWGALRIEEQSSQRKSSDTNVRRHALIVKSRSEEM